MTFYYKTLALYEPSGCSSTHIEVEEHLLFVPFPRYHRRSFSSLAQRFYRAISSATTPYGSRWPLSLSPFLHPHPPHGALIQFGIIAVLDLGITEHVCEAGAAVQVTEEIGFEVEHFQVDIHLISYAL